MNVTTKRTLALSLLAALAVILVACSSTPYTGRTQLLLTSESDEMSMGAQLYEETLKDGEVVADRRAARVQRIGRELARTSDRPDWPWEFKLIESEQANAFALPGGKVAVYAGLLDVCANDAQLAAVMGHEIAHATLRHGGERVSQNVVVDATTSLAAIMVSGDPDTQKSVKQAFGMGAQVGVLLPYSRSHESEADYVGLIYMARAGYDPGEAVGLWENMSQLGGSRPPEFLSTHPASSTRIEQIRAKLPEIRAQYPNAVRK